MPKYKITITDADVQKVHDSVERNLQSMKKANEKVGKASIMKQLNFLSKRMGIMIAFTIEWTWDGNICSLELDSTAPLKDQVFDDTAKQLADWGRMRIVKDNGDVIMNG